MTNKGPSHVNNIAVIGCKEQFDIGKENSYDLFQLGADIKPNQDSALLSGPCNFMECASEWIFYVEYR